jgi:anti-sigma B factor antagonist
MTESAFYKIVGRLDGVTAAAHESALRALVTPAQQSLTIDLADLEYVSSAGLRVLLIAAKAVKAAGGAVTLASPAPNVLEVLRMSGFDKIFTITA